MNRTVGIIGTGWVGTSVAISTLHSGAADELWLSSSSKGVLAITALDDKAVGNAAHKGKPGPMFKKMFALMQADMRSA